MFAAIGYWCVAFPTAWLLAFHAGLGAVGVWIGLSIGTFVYAGLLILRFRMLARRLARMTEPVREVTPDVDADALLAGAQFIDAFRVEIGAGRS